ncbi:MAG: aminoglycoside 3'-phosphotransferase [Ruminococcaceae bacterium]|nr:aminoglycoside 3'-phosphotransferase [Oscillospiraceae bacterium]
MKRTPINVNPQDFPIEIRKYIIKDKIYDSSCSKAAKVYFIDIESGYYLKRSEKGSLEREALMTNYFGKIGLGAKVVTYISNEYDWLLTERVFGEDLIHAKALSDPCRLAEFTGKLLRKLHDRDYSDCPIQNRLSEVLEYAENSMKNGSFSCEFHLPEKYRPASLEEAWSFVEENKHLLKADTLIHGDYCLPNVMAENLNFTGFIDLGNSGVSDRHFDIFWGAWTLQFNLHTDEYTNIFFDAYGRDRIDFKALKTVAYIECFT